MKHGFAFGEHIKTGTFKRRNYDESPKTFTLRDFLFPLVLVGVAALLFWKLFSLQIMHGDDYRKLADSNRIRTLVIPAPRGIIFDRNGNPLVYNTPGFREIVKDPKRNPPYKIVHLSKEEALAKLSKGAQNIGVDSLRQYPQKDELAHVIGYIGQISKEELENSKFAGYLADEWIGKEGIEQQYESLLRGTNGKQLIEVDALGHPVRALGQTDPIPGQDITLTIDEKLQDVVYKATSGVKRGAVIVSRPDGEILSLISRPTFDPNLFTLDKTYKTSSTSAYTTLSSILLDSQNHPLLNRAIGGIYPPGSTFKIVTAATGLQDHVIDENYQVEDTGILKVGDFSFANWYYTEYGRRESGNLNVVRALARSNDIFFYKLAEKVNVERLSSMAEEFGIGKKLGIDLSGEATGLVPSKKWKSDHLKESWYLGDTYHYGIGQGYLLTTPLQVNAWTQAIANNGTLYQPRLLENQESRIKNQEFLSDKTTGLIRQGMIASCSTGGVAWPLFDFKVQNAKLKVDGKNFLSVASSSADTRKVAVACKTGTAQHGGEDTLPHAWITLFAPAYDPQIVVTVLVEESGEGSNVAAPIAKKILEAYFSPR